MCLQAAPNVEYRLENRGCTKTCGGGVIDFQLVCVEIGDGAVATPVDESVCIQQQIPRPQVPTETCNNLPCPPQFILGAWTPCSSSCEQGTRARSVRYNVILKHGWCCGWGCAYSCLEYLTILDKLICIQEELN